MPLGGYRGALYTWTDLFA